MRLIHVALRCRSEENADRFYANLLELRKQAPKTLAGPLSKQIFALSREREFRIINYMNHHLHFEIFIDDLQAAGKERVDHVCIGVKDLTRISHAEHQIEWQKNTISINSNTFYLIFVITDCQSVEQKN